MIKLVAKETEKKIFFYSIKNIDRFKNNIQLFINTLT